MAKAVAIGEKHLVLGFKGVGFDVLAASDEAAFSRELNRAGRDPEVGLILVTESLAALAPQVLLEFRSTCSTIVTVIPSHEGSLGTGFQEMRKAVERSLGVDLLGKTTGP